MKVETFKDKVTLTEGEIRVILKDHIEKMTGRKVTGDINVHVRANSFDAVTALLEDK